MITPEQLRELQNAQWLSIGDAWNALGEAADTIEELLKLRIGDGNPHRDDTIEEFQAARKNREQRDGL